MPAVTHYASGADGTRGNVAWTNPGNVAADDGVYAQRTSLRRVNEDEYWLIPAFSEIPQEATITSVLVEVQWKEASNQGMTRLFQLYCGTTAHTPTLSGTSDPTADTTQSFSPTGVDWADAQQLAVLTRFNPDKNDVVVTIDFIRVTINYAIRAAITARMPYDITGRVGALRRLPYTVRGTTGITLSTPYAITDVVLVVAQISANLPYTIASSAAASRALSYIVRSQAGPTRSLTYSLRALATVNRSVPFGVAAIVALARSLPYTIRQTVSAGVRSLPFTVRAGGGLTRSLPYAVRNMATASRGMPYSLRQLAAIARILRYDIRAIVTITQRLNYATSGLYVIDNDDLFGAKVVVVDGVHMAAIDERTYWLLVAVGVPLPKITEDTPILEVTGVVMPTVKVEQVASPTVVEFPQSYSAEITQPDNPVVEVREN